MRTLQFFRQQGAPLFRDQLQRGERLYFSSTRSVVLARGTLFSDKDLPCAE